MNPRSSKPRLSFHAKILVPVIALLVLLPAITVAFVHRTSMQQLQKDAREKLFAAEEAFGKALLIQRRHLLVRFRNVVTEPRFKAVAQLADPRTMTAHLDDLLSELEDDAEFLQFHTAEGECLATARRTPTPEPSNFQKVTAPTVHLALAGQAEARLVELDKHLYHVVSLPVVVNDFPVGTLSVGVRFGAAALQELAATPHSEVILYANGEIVDASLSKLKHQPADLLFPTVRKDIPGLIRPLLVEGIHFLGIFGKFEEQTTIGELGYILLSSYEEPLQRLRQTQAALWLLGSVGIGISAVVIWIVIGRITAPLRELRKSAEAVGGGDFSQRVQLSSNDELGLLAESFNTMTENLERSHRELEKTVETLRATQAQLIQSEKLSAVGEFVAGVAHELNNPLTSVIGFSELLKNAPLEGKEREFLRYISKSTERCQKIVQGLLSFARQHPPEQKMVNANELLEGVLDILAYEMRTSNIEVETHFQTDLPAISADSHQLQQVFLNLVNNARQAIETHQSAGKIQITTQAKAGKLLITFADTGPGISPENLRKIFDPFFTTKPIGKGTGLGLSLCYGIVQEHGGKIEVSSQLGQGAVFTIELPCRNESALPESDLKPSDSAPLLDGHGKRALVVDDEEWIVELVRHVLQEDGFTVDAAGNGQAALDLVSKTDYELLVCDWKMPGLSGPQLYERISSVNREASERVIFMTGDVVNDSFQAFITSHTKTCLSKPFSVQQFRDAVASFVNRRN